MHIPDHWFVKRVSFTSRLSEPGDSLIFQIAPVLTLVIGGNHESSGYMQELPYGGWLAPKIYYLGHASVVSYAGLRIGGLSGIYKSIHYDMGIFFRAVFSLTFFSFTAYCDGNSFLLEKYHFT